MGKILSLVIGLGVLGYVGYRAMYGRRSVDQATPQQQLQNVRDASKRIEAESEERAKRNLDRGTDEIAPSNE